MVRAGPFSFFVMSNRSKEMMLQTMLMQGVWTPAEVSLMLDTPAAIVLRWCRVGLLPGARERLGVWEIPGRSLFLFCGRRLEPHYSLETVAALLDKSVETVRGWAKRGLLAKIKLGTGKSASVLVAESELRRWMSL